jgi:hypothetical protein
LTHKREKSGSYPHSTIDNTLYRMVKCVIKNAKGAGYDAYICK